MSATASSAAMGGSQSRPTTGNAQHPDRVSRLSPELTEQKMREIVQQNIQDLRAYCAKFHAKCRVCDASLSWRDTERQVEAWRAGAQVIPPKAFLSAFPCSACNVSTCVGCGKLPTLSSLNLFTPLGVINHCCEKGRLFGIWFLLSRIDQDRLEKASLKSSAIASRRPGKGKQGKGASGVGYASDHSSMYMGNDFLDPYGAYYGVPSTVTTNDEEDRKAQDYLMIETLKILSVFLPDPKYRFATDEELIMFRMGMLFDQITELLQNDSISDVTDRHELYVEVLAFLIKAAKVPRLLDLLLEPRPEKSKSPGIQELGSPTLLSLKNDLTFTDSPAMSPPLFQAMKNIYHQAQTYIQLAPKLKFQTPNSQISKEPLKLCQSVIELYKILDGNANQNSLTRTLELGNVGEEAWKEFAENNRVTFTDEVLKNHRYLNEATNLAASSVKNRLNTISKEVAMLTTSLPIGVFIKVAESRSDIMKVLIIGSEGSPYAGGLFTFDLFLDANYPTKPPKISFVLEGNDDDKYSFNPNLHAGSGTVCLSLLNTWHGSPNEMWQPNKSTLLSVLVSIQAMILGVPYPWLNEPGHENDSLDDSIVVENKRVVQGLTVRHAMTPWVENDLTLASAREHVWRDISSVYWKHHGRKVLDTVVGWVEENPSLKNWTRLYRSHGPPKIMKKSKGKAKVAEAGAEVVGGINLIDKFAAALGFESPFPPEPVVEEGSPTSKTSKLMQKLRGKRKASGGEGGSSASAVAGSIPHHTKKQKSVSPPEIGVVPKWIYTGPKSQKDTRAACKEFGIGSAPTIKATIAKLENHVNGKGKVSTELVQKWGQTIQVEDESMDYDYPDFGMTDSKADGMEAMAAGFKNFEEMMNMHKHIGNTMANKYGKDEFGLTPEDTPFSGSGSWDSLPGGAGQS